MVTLSARTNVLTGSSSLLSGRAGDRGEQQAGGTDHWDRAEPKRPREEKASHRWVRPLRTASCRPRTRPMPSRVTCEPPYEVVLVTGGQNSTQNALSKRKPFGSQDGATQGMCQA